MALEAHGGEKLFGEPGFNIQELMATSHDGRGVINLLHADELTRAPKLYAIFLLWLMSRLFIELSEAGDLDKPKLVFFFDEAHLLFKDAPKPLMTQIEQLVRLIRSKGVGIYFVTQTIADVPEVVASQLGNRVQHALRAFTPKDQKFIKATAAAFRPNPDIDVKSEITAMGTGEALVSFLKEDGSPSVVQKIKVAKPIAQIGPVSDLERKALLGRELIGTQAEKDIDARIYDNWLFTNRMRAERGLELRPEPEPYTPYEFDLIAEFGPVERVEERSFMSALISTIFYSIAFVGLGWFSLKMFGLI